MIRKNTKDIIVESLMELAGYKPYYRITVRDIAETAEISTVTFYKFFRNKEDVYRYATYKNMEKRLAHLGETYTWYEYIRETIRENQEAQKLISNVTNLMDEYTDSIRILVDNNEEFLIRYICKEYGEDVIDDSLRCSLRLYLYGALNLMTEDIKNGMKSDPDTLAANLIHAMPSDLKKYIP